MPKPQSALDNSEPTCQSGAIPCQTLLTAKSLCELRGPYPRNTQSNAVLTQQSHPDATELDNCEHLVQACAEMVEELLRASTSVAARASSTPSPRVRAPATTSPTAPASTNGFRQGGGVPYSAYCPDFTGVMDGLSRDGYDRLLIDAWLPMLPGLEERLQEGARVADVACGSGHALVVLARTFPNSTLVGYDLDDEALGRGRAEAAAAGLRNVAFVMKEPRLSSNLEDKVGSRFAPMTYAVSTLHCMTISLAEGRAGLGTAFGEQLARRMLADAGFTNVMVHEAPGNPRSGVFVSTRPAAASAHKTATGADYPDPVP